METVFDQNSVGVLLTYQLSLGSDRRVWIADGRQRTEATKRYINNPQYYGSGMTSDQIKEKIENFLITVQHRHYETHDKAMVAFQNLNKGTLLTPYEFYRGELCKSELGQIAHSKIPLSVDRFEKSVVTARNPTRDQEHINNRDSYSLFLQYHSRHRGLTFWPVATRKVKSQDGKIVETELHKWLEKNSSLSQIEKQIRKFEGFIASQHQLIMSIRDDVGIGGKSMSRTLYRWLLHLGIWRRNTNKVTVEAQIDLVNRIFNAQKPFKNISSRFSLSDENDEIHQISIQVSALNEIRRLSRLLGGIFFQQMDTKRNSQGVVDYGLDQSHLLPFSSHGDGPTFPEPASKNRARGANPVSDDD
jgi:hypothetical protein